VSAFVEVGTSRTSRIDQTQRAELALPVYVGLNGYIQNAGFTQKPITALEHGALNGPVAVVMHRTDSYSSVSVFSSFEASGIGTHFVVDKDGTVYQTASLLQRTFHIGKIKPRCRDENTCGPEEAAALRRMSFAQINTHEMGKPYPTRYPANPDSVGIEVVAKHRDDGWEAPTANQRTSISLLVDILKNAYGLSNADIYEHDKISYKTEGEGAGLYDARPVGLPPRFEGRGKWGE